MPKRWLCVICGYVHEGESPPAICPVCAASFTAFQDESETAESKFGGIEIPNPNPPGYRYVIIGNSAAGRSAARAIRALDPQGSVIVVSEESVRMYARPMLPDLIAGMSRALFFASGKIYNDSRIELLQGVRAEQLDTGGKQVHLSDGTALEYDSLLLATGSEPIRIPWPGSDAVGIAYFRDFADAEEIARLAKESQQAVVVGGGLIGLEFLRAFTSIGLKVTHLVREPYVGYPALDAQAGALIRKAVEQIGVEVACQEEVEEFVSRDGQVCGVRTNRGRTLECGVVGIAVGVRPRVELAVGAGLTVNRGIVVGEDFRTSAPDVYAAGDAVEALDRLWHEPRVNPSWQNALHQGELAGIAMAGGRVRYEGSTAGCYQLVAGMPMCSLGIANPPDSDVFSVDREVDESAMTYRKIVRRGDVVVGGVMVGDLSAVPEL